MITGLLNPISICWFLRRKLLSPRMKQKILYKYLFNLSLFGFNDLLTPLSNKTQSLTFSKSYLKPISVNPKP